MCHPGDLDEVVRCDLVDCPPDPLFDPETAADQLLHARVSGARTALCAPGES